MAITKTELQQKLEEILANFVNFTIDNNIHFKNTIDDKLTEQIINLTNLYLSRLNVKNDQFIKISLTSNKYYTELNKIEEIQFDAEDFVFIYFKLTHKQDTTYDYVSYIENLLNFMETLNIKTLHLHPKHSSLQGITVEFQFVKSDYYPSIFVHFKGVVENDDYIKQLIVKLREFAFHPTNEKVKITYTNTSFRIIIQNDVLFIDILADFKTEFDFENLLDFINEKHFVPIKEIEIETDFSPYFKITIDINTNLYKTSIKALKRIMHYFYENYQLYKAVFSSLEQVMATFVVREIKISVNKISRISAIVNVIDNIVSKQLLFIKKFAVMFEKLKCEDIPL